MSKILSTYRIDEYLALEGIQIMNNPNYTNEEKQEHYNQLQFINNHIKEIIKDIHTCTCDECSAWEQFTDNRQAFSAEGGYLGFCRVWQCNTQEGDFCSESYIKNPTQKI